MWVPYWETALRERAQQEFLKLGVCGIGEAEGGVLVLSL